MNIRLRRISYTYKVPNVGTFNIIYYPDKTEGITEIRIFQTPNQAALFAYKLAYFIPDQDHAESQIIKFLTGISLLQTFKPQGPSEGAEGK